MLQYINYLLPHSQISNFKDPETLDTDFRCWVSNNIEPGQRVTCSWNVTRLL